MKSLLLPGLLGLSIAVFAQASPGQFFDSGQNLWLNNTTQNSFGFEIGDMNGDGHIDIIAGGYCSKQNAVYLNDGSGNFTTVLPYGTNITGDCTEQLTVGDIDGDGDLDAIHSRNQPYKIYLNDGSGNLSLSGTLSTSSAQGVHLVDVDGDNDLDVAVNNYTGPNLVRIFKNDGSGNFSLFMDVPGNASNIFMNSADFDLDGDQDIIITERFPSGQEAVILWNDGIGNFTKGTQIFGSRSYAEAAIGDINGDGAPDFMVANNIGAPATIWLNNGSGSFSLQQSISAGNSIGGAFADYDNDGDEDLFIAKGGGNQVWLNDGSGNFTNSGQSLGTCNSWHARPVDFNGDGFIDIATANPGGPNKVWFNNIFIATPTLCPDAIVTNELQAGNGGVNVQFSANLPNQCVVNATYSHQPGSFFTLGTTAVTVSEPTAGSCTFDVTVLPFGVVSIPTMGEWALIFLGSLVVFFGAFQLRKLS